MDRDTSQQLFHQEEATEDETSTQKLKICHCRSVRWDYRGPFRLLDNRLEQWNLEHANRLIKQPTSK